MSEIEDKLGSILSNPQLMQQIMNMAQSLGQQSSSTPPRQEQPTKSSGAIADIDPAMIGRIMSIAGRTGIDDNQKALLCALQPYINHHRLQKLEKAMHAARLAGAASSLLQNGSIPFPSGR